MATDVDWFREHVGHEVKYLTYSAHEFGARSAAEDISNVSFQDSALTRGRALLRRSFDQSSGAAVGAGSAAVQPPRRLAPAQPHSERPALFIDERRGRCRWPARACDRCHCVFFPARGNSHDAALAYCERCPVTPHA